MELIKKYGVEIQIDLGTLTHNPEEIKKFRPYPTNWSKLVWIKFEDTWYLVKTSEACDIIAVKMKLLKTYNKEQFLSALLSFSYASLIMVSSAVYTVR